MATAGRLRLIVYLLALAGLAALVSHGPHALVPTRGEPHGCESACPLCLVSHSGAVVQPPPAVALELPSVWLDGPRDQAGPILPTASLLPDLRGPPRPAA